MEDIMTGNNRAKNLTYVLFIIYLIALFWIIVIKFNIPQSYLGDVRRINLVPFGDPMILNGKPDSGENIMNVIIFVPLGIYAGVIFQRWIIWKKISLFFLVSLICEGLQFILKVGVFDITDIITNTLGGIMGFLLFQGIEKAFGSSFKAQKFINTVALIGTSLMIILLFLVRINHLWIFRMNTLHPR
jgi:glycopeptide antibiotics resistance protein